MLELDPFSTLESERPTIRKERFIQDSSPLSPSTPLPQFFIESVCDYCSSCVIFGGLCTQPLRLIPPLFSSASKSNELHPPLYAISLSLSLSLSLVLSYQGSRMLQECSGRFSQRPLAQYICGREPLDHEIMMHLRESNKRRGRGYELPPLSLHRSTEANLSYSVYQTPQTLMNLANRYFSLIRIKFFLKNNKMIYEQEVNQTKMMLKKIRFDFYNLVFV